MQKVNYCFQGFLNRLQKAGYTSIGKGCYARVYAHPNKKTVLKVFGYDEGYLPFCKSIINSDNPYFPQIKKITEYQSNTHTHSWYVVEMERLISFQFDENMKEEVSKSCNVYLGKGEYQTYKYGSFESYIVEYNPDEHDDTKLAEAIAILKQIRQENLLGYDIHTGNVMLRQTDNNLQLVFTDPFVK